MTTTKTLNLRKALLAGTAIVAAGAFSTGAQAADLTLAGNSTYGTTAPVNAPTAGDNIDLNSFDLTVNNTNSTAIGAITDTGTPADGNITVTSSAAADITQTIGSVNTSGNFSQTGVNAQNSTITTTVSGDFTLGGNFAMTSDEADAADTNNVTITGNTAITGTTGVTAGGAVAGANATLNVDGATNVFTGAVTITGGGHADADANLVLSGASNTFTGGLTLTDATGQAILTLDGTTAQTLTGNIAGDGDIIVANASGATFSGTVTSGTVTVETAGGDAAATFQNTLTSAVTLGGAGTGTNTLTLDTTTQAFTVTGAVAGAIAGETNNIVISGDDILTQATGWTANIDAINVNETSTLDSNAALTTSGAITIASGAKLDQGAGLITATGGVANSGTIQFTGTGNLTGDVTGTGALDVDAATTITGAITQSTADIAAVTLTQAGGTNAYNVGTTTFSAAGTLALAAGNKAVTGNFTNTTDGQGTITIADGAGTTTIVGDLGASTDNSLAALTMGAGATAQTVTTTGNLYVDAITIDATDTLQFLGTSTQTVSGTIVGQAAGEGVLTIGDGTTASDVVFNGVVGTGAGADIASVTVSAGAQATYNANLTTDGTYTNTAGGTTIVGVGATVEANDFTDTGSYVLQANDANGTLAATDFGSLNSTGGGDTLTATNLTIDVTGEMTAGTVQLLTGFNLGAATLEDNSIQYSFAVADNGANSDVTVSRASLASLSDSSTTSGVGAALDGVAGTTDAQLASLLDAAASQSTSAGLNDVLEATTSVNSGAGAAVAGIAFSGETSAISNTRLASLRDGATTGMSAGNHGEGLKVWGQAFGTTGEQDDRDGVSGYDVDSYGVAAGIDTENMAEDMVIGLAVAYADTEVDSDGVANANTEIDSYQVAVYGDYDLDEHTYLTGQVSYTWSENDTTRNPGGLSSLVAKGSYDASQINVRAELARDYGMSGGLTLTPSVLANYVHYDADGYTETGAGGANLRVDSDSLNVFEVGVGVDAAWKVENNDGSYVKPVLSAGVRHDLVGDEFEATNTFTGGGSAFKVEGFDPAQTTFDVGAGVTYFTTGGWDLSAEYDYEFKSDYDSHSGLVKASYNF